MHREVLTAEVADIIDAGASAVEVIMGNGVAPVDEYHQWDLTRI